MRGIHKALLVGAAALTMTASAARAEIVCNDEGDCWHIKTRHEFRPEFGVKIYPDNWRWEEREAKKYRWREHEGRGYWRNGIWLEF
jgi:hypothetical protein